jgi:hypothetical protein
MPIELPVTTTLKQGASTAYGFWLTFVSLLLRNYYLVFC